MRHARPEDLGPIEPLLDRIRDVDGLVERKPGTFYRGSHAFLHFHIDDAGIFADVKVDGDFLRRRVSTAREQEQLLVIVKRSVRASRG